MHMVSIFSGEVNRTWRFVDSSGSCHEVSLYHHPLTGARAAMVDHEELEGSLGTSSVFHSSTTSIPFVCGNARGSINIQRDKMLGFNYACVADGVTIPEAAGDSSASSRRYEARVVGRCSTVDHLSTQQPTITWYVVETREDGKPATKVHRRFRDFVELDESVRAALSGHHMLSSMPGLPSKRFKFAVDHNDASFLDEREAQLDIYARRLAAVPHAWAAPATAPFFGVAANAREYSLVFSDRTLGFTIGKSAPKKMPGIGMGNEYEPADFPAYVASVQRHAAASPGVGHLLSKVSGRATCASAFKDVIASVKHTPRPIMIHFIAPKTSSMSSEEADDAPSPFGDSSRREADHFDQKESNNDDVFKEEEEESNIFLDNSLSPSVSTRTAHYAGTGSSPVVTL